jgi:hypothetical protein
VEEGDMTADLLLVSPTLNERSNLEELVSRVFAAVPGCHLLIVDDRSEDGTAALCRELRRTHPGLELLERPGPRGLGRAYVAGLQYGLARGHETIGTLDADLSHDPACLPSMLALMASHDVVIGSRYVRDGGTVNWKIWRIVLSVLANRLAAWLLRIPERCHVRVSPLPRLGAGEDSPRPDLLDRLLLSGRAALPAASRRVHHRGAADHLLRPHAVQVEAGRPRDLRRCTATLADAMVDRAAKRPPAHRVTGCPTKPRR